MIMESTHNPLKYFRCRKFLSTCLILSSVVALVGCAVQIPMEQPPDEWNIPKGSLKDELSLSAHGHQQFRCSSDSQGYYWQFIKTEADLYDTLQAVTSFFTKVPPVGKLVAYSGVKQSFTHFDGSSLRTTGIIRNTPSILDGNISNLMLKARSSGKGKRAFDSVDMVLRTNTSGGMPTQACGAANLGKLHNSEFRATYTFLK